jgi:HD superfamily phosphohydrolase
MTLADLPEIQAFDLIRIPHEMDVPLTSRAQALIDSAEFRRVARISQLGLVALVYPAAHHTRFEHSLGVYRNALLYLRQLMHEPRFAELIRPQDAQLLMVAALLHDLGHWPFCHPIEDIQLPGVPNHELFANSFLLEGEIADTLRDEWQLNPRDVVSFLSEKPRDARMRVLKTILSGPIDIDKMDYLPRDSLHAGVPYGRNFDQQRLVGSLCLNEAGDGLAITEKGKTAAEMMVFARYVMFSEVYWHHAVRAATAMFQRGFYLLHADLDCDRLFRLAEPQFIMAILEEASGTPAEELFTGLFGPQRRLYKRFAEFSYFQERELYEQIARSPYRRLVEVSERIAEVLSTRLGKRIAPHQVLVDAPPVKREVEFRVDVRFPKENCYRSLGDISPAVHTLATKQFDDFVKRVRVFVAPEIADAVHCDGGAAEVVAAALGLH